MAPEFLVAVYYCVVPVAVVVACWLVIRRDYGRRR